MRFFLSTLTASLIGQCPFDVFMVSRCYLEFIYVAYACTDLAGFYLVQGRLVCTLYIDVICYWMTSQIVGRVYLKIPLQKKSHLTQQRKKYTKTKLTKFKTCSLLKYLCPMGIYLTNIKKLMTFFISIY